MYSRRFIPRCAYEDHGGGGQEHREVRQPNEDTFVPARKANHQTQRDRQSVAGHYKNENCTHPLPFSQRPFYRATTRALDMGALGSAEPIRTEILSGLKSATCGEQIVLSQTAVSGCYKGSFVIPCISSLLAAVRIFFLSRTDMALKSSPCDSNSPSLNGNALGPR